MNKTRMKTTATLLIAIFMISTFAVAIPVSAQNTWYIPTDFTTIQDAIDSTSVLNGDILIVAAGTYNEAIVLDKALTIDGAGIDDTIINAGGAAVGIKIRSSVVLDSVTIKDLTVENVVHSNINVYHTTVTNFVIDNVDLSGSGWAGLLLNGGTVEDFFVEGCTFGNFKRFGVRVDSGSIVGHLTVIDSDFSTTEYARIIDGILSQSGIESCGLIDELTVSGGTFTGMVNGIRLFWYWTDRTTYSIDNVDIEGSTFVDNDAGFFFCVSHYRDGYPPPVEGYAIGDIQIHDCSFTESEWGVNFDDDGVEEAYEDVVIDASLNYWDSPRGPSRAMGKAVGHDDVKGCKVSTNVIFAPWLRAP